jgi:hypothetical protein
MVVEGVMGYEHAPSLMRVSTDAMASDPSQIDGVPGKRGDAGMPASSLVPSVAPPDRRPEWAGHLARSARRPRTRAIGLGGTGPPALVAPRAGEQTLTFPKAEAAKPREIEVQAA